MKLFVLFNLLILTSAASLIGIIKYDSIEEEKIDLDLGRDIGISVEESLMKDLREGRRSTFSHNDKFDKFELMKLVEGQEDIDLIEEFFHDQFITVPFFKKIQGMNLIEPMKRIFKRNPILAFKEFSIEFLNEQIEDEAIASSGFLSGYFKMLVKFRSWFDIEDMLLGCRADKMAKLKPFDVIWSAEELTDPYFMKYLIRFIFLMNIYKFQIRLLSAENCSSSVDVQVMEIRNGFGLDGAKNLMFPCWKCRETILTHLHGKPVATLDQDNSGCCVGFLNTRPARKARNRMEYEHSCPKCGILLLKAKDEEKY